MKKTKLFKILSVIFLMVPSFYSLSIASNCTAHQDDQKSETAEMQSVFETPCEISGIILMAETKEICSTLKNKISSHDHD